MLHRKPPLHPGVPYIIGNNGNYKVVPSKNGIATKRLVRLPTGEIVKKLRPPLSYMRPYFPPVTRKNSFKLPEKPIEPMVRQQALRIKPSMPGLGLNYEGNDADGSPRSPPIPSRYGGSRKKRRFTKRRSRTTVMCGS